MLTKHIGTLVLRGIAVHVRRRCPLSKIFNEFKFNLQCGLNYEKVQIILIKIKLLIGPKSYQLPYLIRLFHYFSINNEILGSYALLLHC